MSARRLLLLTPVAMALFAANSLLCRIALKDTAIDPVSFTAIRVISGAIVLSLILLCRNTGRKFTGNWPSAWALLAYAALFSWSYVALSAATGALLLFSTVQLTMIAAGLYFGERPNLRQNCGALLALAGLLMLLLPGATAPPIGAAMMMLAAGLAWGIYSLRGRGSSDPIAQTAGNFLRAVPGAAALCLLTLPWMKIDGTGALYAIASGAVASGLGYAVWYSVLPSLSRNSAASLQLCVPALAALGGVVILDEPITARLAICSAVILGGIALVLARRPAA